MLCAFLVFFFTASLVGLSSIYWLLATQECKQIANMLPISMIKEFVLIKHIVVADYNRDLFKRFTFTANSANSNF